MTTWLPYSRVFNVPILPIFSSIFSEAYFIKIPQSPKRHLLVHILVETVSYKIAVN
jgi:hypothetical protein